MALVQQTEEQTYKFTGSQRECSFMLMVSRLSIFLIIERFILRTVVNHTSGSFYDVVAQVTVAGLAHPFILGLKIARIVIVPNDAAILGKSVCILESLDGTEFCKDASRINLTDSRYGIEHGIFLRV